jgi:cytidylate kinase
MPPRILTVSGLIGSGKTSVCRKIEALTGWRVVSAGTILRKMAEESGLTVIEFNERAKTDASIDKKIDDSLRALNNTTEPLIVDSRLAWHFIPSGYKIHLVVDQRIAAQRVFSAKRPDEHYQTPTEAYAANAQRQQLENERFKHYYGIDCEKWENYDLVLDTGTLSPEELAEYALKAYARLAHGPECHLDPQRIEISSPSPAPEHYPPLIRVHDHQIVAVAGESHICAAQEMAAPLLACALA